MKVDNSVDPLQSGASPLKDHAARKPRTAPAAEPVAPNAQSSLKLSGLSSRLKQIETSLGSSEAFDTARVNEIRQAVRNGSFKVNAQAVADKLLANAHDLFAKRH